MENQNAASSQRSLPSVTVPFSEEKTDKPVPADRIDRIFACLCLLLGFGFIYTFTSERLTINIRIFTLAYLLFVSAYLALKKIKPSKESYFWFLILCSLGFFFSAHSLIFPLIQIGFLILTAAYWTACAGGALMDQGKSSQWLLFDGISTVFVTPFSNFLCHVKVLACTSRDETTDGPSVLKRIRSVLLGLIIAVPFLLVALPLLGRADRSFAALLNKIGSYFQEGFYLFVIRLLLSLPVTACMFGLVYGAIHKRNTDRFSKKQIHETTAGFRIIPNLAVHTTLLTLCLIYLLFITMQGTYLFSAFLGIRPDAYSYAEYARQGFFELCQVAVLNISVLLGADSFGKTARKENRILRFMNVILSLLTLFLLLTAASKMLLYISAYGLTGKRVLTMVFMLWLLVVFVLFILWQFRPIAMVRISFLTGAALYTLLCVLPVSQWILQYNQTFFPVLCP